MIGVVDIAFLPMQPGGFVRRSVVPLPIKAALSAYPYTSIPPSTASVVNANVSCRNWDANPQSLNWPKLLAWILSAWSNYRQLPELPSPWNYLSAKTKSRNLAMYWPILNQLHQKTSQPLKR